MKKALTLVMILGLVSIFAAETVKPAPITPKKAERTIVIVDKTVINEVVVEKNVVRQVKKEPKKDVNKK